MLKFQRLEYPEYTKAAKWEGQDDIRTYIPPEGFEAAADVVDIHPVTGEQLEQSEWWIFIRPIE